MTASSTSDQPAVGREIFSGGQALCILECDRPPATFADLAAIREELALLPPARLIDCRRTVGGAWAGALSLLESLVPEIDAEAPDLLDKHRDELAGISPKLRRRFPDRRVPLTESGPVKERVRSYPVDRAFRLVHGLVDLVLTWQRRPGAEPMELVCWRFDDAGAMTSRFLRELERRSATARGLAPIRLALVVAPGAATQAAVGFTTPIAAAGLLKLESAARAPSLESLQSEAERLEKRLDSDVQEVEQEAARLVGLFDHLGQPLRAARWRVLLLAVLNHWGWYEDALYFAEPVIDQLDSVSDTEARFSRWHIVSGLFNALAALGRAEEAHVLVRDEALAKVEDPVDLVSIYYTMAMLHVRFLPEKDLELGEHFLERSMETVEIANLSNAEKHYLKVFNLNGLAFIRHLQGEPPAAIELCEDGYQHLEDHLAASEYRLHRSVLLYNLAQVHASTGNLDKAFQHYTDAIKIDPNYSEYFNERAGLLLRMQRPEEAVADLERAIQLSPPYPEVWINYGQALNVLGRHEQASAAYTRSLELDPARVLPWLGRAQAREMTGELEGAVADYRRALELEPEQPLVWANVAALEYEGGRLQPALEAIDRAVDQSSEMADLYQNRAVVLGDLGRARAAAADLRHYLQLAPEAEDAVSVQQRLQELEAAALAPA